MSNLFDQFLEDQRYSEEVDFEMKNKTIRLVMTVLSHSELEAIRDATRRQVAKTLECKLSEVNEDSKAFTNVLYPRILQAGVKFPSGERAFDQVSDVLKLRPETIAMLVEKFNYVMARGSNVLFADGDVDSEDIFLSLAEGALSPENFFVRSSPVTQATLVAFLVNRLKTSLQDNAKLTSRCESLEQELSQERPSTESLTASEPE